MMLLYWSELILDLNIKYYAFATSYVALLELRIFKYISTDLFPAQRPFSR